MMVAEFQLGLLLIASNVRPLWGRFDHERPSFDSTHAWTLLSIAALLIAVAVVVYRVSRRRQREFTHDSPRRLFGELCRAHRLSFVNRRLLKRLAAAHGVAEQPAILFVSSSHFETASLPESLRPAAEQIRSLRNQLFS